ncbi:uroporphyrinogen-III C-methyltransferase [Leptolyngbya sp. 15MV]|nr:uroporphyrinogen-III C-methyltransferase [Leptolyngbya sp. 15MV]
MMSHVGTVFLVGAGPGDPDLLTLRAARLIGHAALIVHDGLVDAAVLALAPPSAQLISVAKSRARHTMPQDAINALLVREALAGRDVVRLKGGDPLIFGRGGEEAEACRAARVPVEIVPGISAANGAAAAAHIALTHRDASSIVSFVAGQCKGLAEQDWAGLAGKGRTLVIYMGVKTAPQIAEKLMADGLAPDMPVAVIENGARPQMRVLRGLLAGLPSLVEGERAERRGAAARKRRRDRGPGAGDPVREGGNAALRPACHAHPEGGHHAGWRDGRRGRALRAG